MLAASGVISASPIGWPGIFYISGGLTAVWASVWFWFGCNSPHVSKTISIEEREFLETVIECSISPEKKQTPWKSILLSVPFWAVLIAHSAQNWGFWTLLTEIPTYMKNVLEFDIKSVKNAVEVQIKSKLTHFFFTECPSFCNALFCDVARLYFGQPILRYSNESQTHIKWSRP